MIKKIILVLLFFALVLSFGLLGYYKLNEQEKWKTYVNERFNYSISYPDYWIPGRVADNGDGRTLYKDQDNEIVVYGTETPSPFSTQDDPVERNTINLDDGSKATSLKLKDSEGKIRYIVFFEDQIAQYVFWATVSEHYYFENKDLIHKIAKSLTLKNTFR